MGGVFGVAMAEVVDEGVPPQRGCEALPWADVPIERPPTAGGTSSPRSDLSDLICTRPPACLYWQSDCSSIWASTNCPENAVYKTCW